MAWGMGSWRAGSNEELGNYFVSWAVTLGRVIVAYQVQGRV